MTVVQHVHHARPRLSPHHARGGVARVLGTVLVALVVVAGLGAAPAHATTTITGRVLLPEGYDPDASALSVRARVSEADTSLGEPVGADGTFSLTVAAGEEYRLQLRDPLLQVLTGYLGADGALVEDFADAVVVTAGADVELHPELSRTMSGSVVLPGPADATAVRLEAWTADGRQSWTTAADNGTWTLVGLRPGRTYRVKVSGGPADVALGFVGVDGGVVEAFEDGVPVEAGATDVVVHLSVAPSVTGRVTLPPVLEIGDLVTPIVSLAEHEGDDDGPGRWVVRHRVAVAADGTFRVGRLQDDVAYRLHLDSLGRTLPVYADVPSGWWAGDSSPLVDDAAQARTLRAGADVVVPLPVTNVLPPTTWGWPVRGGVLHASRGVWDPAAPEEVSFHWLRDGRPIIGATSPRYRVTRADLGHDLSVRVVARTAGYTTALARSQPVAVLRMPARGRHVVDAE